jgi:UTP:GlnB (protein PII) uridylyltransferase
VELLWRQPAASVYTETKRALSRGLENPLDREQIRLTQSAAFDMLRGGTDADVAEHLWSRWAMTTSAPHGRGCRLAHAGHHPPSKRR